MAKNTNLRPLILVVGVWLAAACQTKGPAPSQGTATEPVDVAVAERERGVRELGVPADEYHRDYDARLHGSPHKPGDLGVPDSHVSGAVKHVDVGGLEFQAPEGWQYEHPESAMRRAQLGVRSDQGTAGLVVYFFGDRGAGSSKANIDRWVGQFKRADGSRLEGVKPVERKVAGFDLTQVEVAGTYVGGMGSGSPRDAQPGQRMIATIVKTESGPYYFKFLGDDAVVQANRAAFEGLLASLKPSDG